MRTQFTPRRDDHRFMKLLACVIDVDVFKANGQAGRPREYKIEPRSRTRMNT